LLAHCSLTQSKSREPQISRGRRRPGSSEASVFEEPQASILTNGTGPHSRHHGDMTEKPTFPWQKKNHSTNSSSSRQTALTEQNLPSTHDQSFPADQTSVLSSFQEQLTQQQKLLQEQLTNFTMESNREMAAVRASTSSELELVRNKLAAAETQVKELDASVEAKSTELSNKQVQYDTTIIIWTFH